MQLGRGVCHHMIWGGGRRNSERLGFPRLLKAWPPLAKEMVERAVPSPATCPDLVQRYRVRLRCTDILLNWVFLKQPLLLGTTLFV